MLVQKARVSAVLIASISIESLNSFILICLEKKTPEWLNSFNLICLDKNRIVAIQFLNGFSDQAIGFTWDRKKKLMQ